MPGLATRLAGTLAVNWSALMNVVVRAVLPQYTVPPDAKPVPFAVSLNPARPAAIVFGLSDPSAGPETIVMISALDVTPPDLTVI